MFGYKDVRDYYNEISSEEKLKNIQIPTFILNTRDDFLFHESMHPF